MANTAKYSYDQAVSAMTAAHNAGDVENAKKIANYIKQNSLAPSVESEGLAAVEEKTSTVDFYIDQVKQGVADLALSALPDVVLNKMLGIDDLDYLNEDSTLRTEDYFRDREAAIQNAKEEFLNYKGIKPSSELERYTGSALSSVVAEGPLAVVGAKGKIGPLAEVFHSYTAALLGQLGAETFSETAEQLGANEFLQEAAAILGGTIGASSTIGGRAAVGSSIEAARTALNERKRVNQSVDTAAEYVASSEIKQMIDKATEAQPDLDSVIKATVDLQEQVPGLIIPPAATLSENPIYRKNTEYLLRTNPEFYAQAKQSLVDAKTAIDSRKEALFGTSDAQADAKLRASLPKDYSKNLRNVKKRITAIDDQIQKTSDSVSTSLESVDIGQKVTNLMNAKEAAVRAKLSPQYERLINDAEAAGVRFPETSVANIHQAYKALKNEEVFATFPALANKLKTQWAPKKVKPSPIIIPGQPPQKAKMVYKPVSMKEMDSFKTELNKAIRKTKDETQLRILKNLKSTFQQEVSKLPEDFGQKYKELDNSFYVELGIPKSKAGIQQLDSARFQNQVGTYLARPEQAKEFIAFVGDSAIPVVKEAIYSKMQGTGLSGGGVFDKNGMLDAVKLTSFINKNKNLIDTVPGLRAELMDSARLVQKLTEVKASLDSAYNLKAKELGEGFYSAFYKKGLKTVASDIISSEKANQTYLKDIKNFDAETSKIAKQAVRSALIEQAMNSNKTTKDFIADNKKVFDDWFGPAYSKSLETISSSYDLINKIDIDKMKFALDYRNQDALLEKVGISFPQLQSVLRDRISSGMTKLAIIGSKISTSSVSAKRDGKVMELLLNPEAVKAIGKEIEQNKFKVLDEKTVARMASIVNNAIFKGGYFGAAGIEAGLEYEEQVKAAQ